MKGEQERKNEEEKRKQTVKLKKLDAEVRARTGADGRVAALATDIA